MEHINIKTTTYLEIMKQVKELEQSKNKKVQKLVQTLKSTIPEDFNINLPSIDELKEGILKYATKKFGRDLVYYRPWSSIDRFTNGNLEQIKTLCKTNDSIEDAVYKFLLFYLEDDYEFDCFKEKLQDLVFDYLNDNNITEEDFNNIEEINDVLLDEVLYDYLFENIKYDLNMERLIKINKKQLERYNSCF